MKKILFSIFCLIAVIIANAGTNFPLYKGVWANDNAEAVITDSICIFYSKEDSTMQAVLEIPSAGILHSTVFSPDGSVSFPGNVKPLEMSKSENLLVICGQRLKKVEDIETVKPYEMKKCESAFDVGRCLQEWQMGVAYGDNDGMPYCEVNTNRHMFVYLINGNMVYIRAAAARSNNKGTLFFQNIRMMKNKNTGEFTCEIYPNNLSIVQNDLEIDNSKFQPNTCTFNPDGGIYWSLISFSPDVIELNGCGDKYTFTRQTVDSNMKEWIKYVPYSKDLYFPHL